MRVAACLAAIALSAGVAVPAQAHGGHWRGGIGISFGFPVYVGPGYYGPWPAYPAPVVAAQPADVEPPAPPVKAPPEPIFYPRQGQDAAQLEADRQACNRWATTQPSAMADAGVFHRATLACMDGRGYTAR